MTAQDERPVVRARQRRPVPYVLTDAARAALAAWPANRIEHEPNTMCSGDDCGCVLRRRGAQ